MAGAIIAFSTFLELQLGHASLPSAAWVSKAALSLNQPSKAWPFRHCS
jgi:hypothetical protein